MKVLQILPQLNIGGVERGTLDLSKALIQKGHESFVISGGGILVDELIQSGAKHYEIPVHIKSLRTLSLAKNLSKTISSIDPDGYMSIVDREKDVIKSGGEWISSIDVENAVASHPDVMQTAVVGIPHPKWDERPLLFVVSNSGNEINREELDELMLKKFEKWQLPDQVVFLKELPIGATGKVKKIDLREEFKEHYM